MFVRGAFQLGFLPSKPSFGNIALNSCYTEENSQLTWGFSRERKKKNNKRASKTHIEAIT